jgi:hypothetical protein
MHIVDAPGMTDHRTTLLALADEVESNTASTLDLDRRISEAFGVKVGPLWCASVDAALELVPADHGRALVTMAEDCGMKYATVTGLMYERQEGHAVNHARAITAAALRVRAGMV